MTTNNGYVSTLRKGDQVRSTRMLHLIMALKEVGSKSDHVELEKFKLVSVEQWWTLFR